MIRHKAIIMLPLLALAVSACGTVGPLSPAQGNTLPPQAYGQKEAQSAERLSTPSTQSRLGRSDELLKRSERREVDPFDLPPGAPNDVGKKVDENNQVVKPKR